MSVVDQRVGVAERVLGHAFSNRGLLVAAVTHPSFASQGQADYERLEFLGDAVLGMIVGDELFRRFPQLSEGDLTKSRSRLVSRATLADVAGDLGLEHAVLLGPSETGAGARGMRSALSACYEALVAALYLDAGLAEASRFVLASLGDRIAPAPGAAEHPKSALQEVLQARGQVPEYSTVSEEGPPHERLFRVTVIVDGEVLASGSGRSKKEAEVRAAEGALERLSAAG